MTPGGSLKASERKQSPNFPMHRIFSIKDFDALRGFSGEWAVSSYPGGQRMIVQRKSNQVSAYDENGESTPLSESERKYFRKSGEKNFMVAAASAETELHVLASIEYDGTTLADSDVRARRKVLRRTLDRQEEGTYPTHPTLALTSHEGLAQATKE